MQKWFFRACSRFAIAHRLLYFVCMFRRWNGRTFSINTTLNAFSTTLCIQFGAGEKERQFSTTFPIQFVCCRCHCFSFREQKIYFMRLNSQHIKYIDVTTIVYSPVNISLFTFENGRFPNLLVRAELHVRKSRCMAFYRFSRARTHHI